MTDTQHSKPQGKGQPPAFRAWLVQDRDGDEPLWIELAGLWPTKSGKGFTGNLKTPMAATTGRIVITPVIKQDGDKPEALAEAEPCSEIDGTIS